MIFTSTDDSYPDYEPASLEIIEFNSKDEIYYAYKSIYCCQEKYNKSIKNDLDNSRIILAWDIYTSRNFSKSLVIYEKDGEVWEVNGIYKGEDGVGGQWYPRLTSYTSLMRRRLDLTLEDNNFFEQKLRETILIESKF